MRIAPTAPCPCPPRRSRALHPTVLRTLLIGLLLLAPMHSALGAPASDVGAVAWSADGRLVAVGTADGKVTLYDAEQGTVTRSWSAKQGAVNGVAFSPNGYSLATGGADGSVCLWHVATGSFLYRWRTSGGSVRAVAFTGGGRLLLAASWNTGEQTVNVWDPEQHDARRTLVGRGEDVYDMAASAKGSIVAVAVGGETSDPLRLRVWDASNGNQVRRVEEDGGGGRSVAVSPAGDRVYLGCDEGRVRAYDPRAGKRLLDLDTASPAVVGLSLSPDGKVLATGLAGVGQVRLWDVTDPERPRLVGKVPGYGAAHGGVAFSPDGRLLAVAGERSVVLWDAATRNPIRTLSLPGR